MYNDRIFNLAKIFVDEKEHGRLMDEIDDTIKTINELYNLDFSDSNFSDFNSEIELNMDLDKIKKDITINDYNNDTSEDNVFLDDLLLYKEKNNLVVLKLKSTILQEQ